MNVNIDALKENDHILISNDRNTYF